MRPREGESLEVCLERYRRNIKALNRVIDKAIRIWIKKAKEEMDSDEILELIQDELCSAWLASIDQEEGVEQKMFLIGKAIATMSRAIDFEQSNILMEEGDEIEPWETEDD